MSLNAPWRTLQTDPNNGTNEPLSWRTKPFIVWGNALVTQWTTLNCTLLPPWSTVWQPTPLMGRMLLMLTIAIVMLMVSSNHRNVLCPFSLLFSSIMAAKTIGYSVSANTIVQIGKCSNKGTALQMRKECIEQTWRNIIQNFVEKIGCSDSFYKKGLETTKLLNGRQFNRGVELAVGPLYI